jgi:carbon monoxide dehydrogenase subunit G
MAFRFEKTFVIRASAPAVWAFLTDPARVARCMPGASIAEQIDDRTYAGTMTVKVGPVQATYKGQLRFEQLDPAARTAHLAASGQDTRGKGGADMRLTSQVSERAPGETEVRVSSEVNVTGVLAQFGRGMIQDVSDQLFHKLTDAVRAELEPPAPRDEASDAARAGEEALAASPAPSRPPPHSSAAQPPLDVGALGAAAAGRAIERTVRRPGLWVALGLFALILWWIFSS